MDPVLSGLGQNHSCFRAVTDGRSQMLVSSCKHLGRRSRLADEVRYLVSPRWKTEGNAHKTIGHFHANCLQIWLSRRGLSRLAKSFVLWLRFPPQFAPSAEGICLCVHNFQVEILQCSVETIKIGWAWNSLKACGDLISVENWTFFFVSTPHIICCNEKMQSSSKNYCILLNLPIYLVDLVSLYTN